MSCAVLRIQDGIPAYRQCLGAAVWGYGALLRGADDGPVCSVVSQVTDEMRYNPDQGARMMAIESPQILQLRAGRTANVIQATVLAHAKLGYFAFGPYAQGMRSPERAIGIFLQDVSGH